MKSVPEILQCVGFGLCNLAMVGNFRVMLTEMEWHSSSRVVVYKFCRSLQLLFYIAFAAYYKLAGVSFTLGADPIIDNKVQYIVLLFVLSGFLLQLQMLNTVSEFDKCNRLRTDYQIVEEEEGEEGRRRGRKEGAVANCYYYKEDSNSQQHRKEGELQLSKQQQLYLINLLQQQLQQSQQQPQSPHNDSSPMSRQQVKYPHYPSINQLPTLSNSNIKISHNLNQVRKFEKKVKRNPIEY